MSQCWSSPLLDLDRAVSSPHLPVVFCRSASTHLHPQLDIFFTPSHPHSLPASTVLYSQLLWLFIGPVSFLHLQGGRVVTVGPQSLSGVLHRNENAPCWCRDLFLSLSPCRLAWYYFVVHVQSSMCCKDNMKNGVRVNKIPQRGVWGLLTGITPLE